MLSRLKDYPITIKIVMLCFITCIVGLFLSAAITVGWNYYSFKQELSKDIKVLSGIVSNRSQAAIAFDDPLLANTNLKALASHSSVHYACLYAHAGANNANPITLFAQHLTPNSQPCPSEADFMSMDIQENTLYSEQYIDVITAVKLDNNIVGYLLMRASLKETYGLLIEQFIVAIIAILIASLTALVIALKLGRIISGPMQALGDKANQIAEINDYSLRAKKESDDEVGKVVDSFNYMLQKIEQKNEQLSQSEERFRLLSASSSAGIFQTDTEGKCIYTNEKLGEISGLSSHEILNKGWMESIHKDDRKKIQAQWQQCIQKGIAQVFDCRFDIGNGMINWATGHIALLYDSQNAPIGFLGTISDVSDLKQAQTQLEHLAFYDVLTGLANRRLFRDRLENMLEQVARQDSHLALLFIDVDHFKHVNDTLGHDAGDELLRVLASRFTNTVRSADTVARLGGDEFTIILNEVKDPFAVSQVAANIIKAIEKPIKLENHSQEITLTASIGIAMAPTNSDNAEALVKQADLALYKAKDEGRNNFQFFNEDMNTQLVQRLNLIRDLRQAMIKQEFEVHYQPQFSISTKQVIGFEALVRWRHPEKGMISPAIFIDIMEDTDMINPLGEWVLRTACETMDGLIRDRLVSPNTSMSVNLSPKQIKGNNINASVLNILNEFNIQPHNIELEITESCIIEQMELAKQQLESLKKLGVRIAIDDFGTGHSSLRYLKELPMDIVKIDRSFVKDLPDDTDDAAIANTIIAMAHNLNYEVVAEGIETEAQIQFLSNSDCDYGQGFHYAKPLNQEDLISFLENKQLAHA